MIERCAPPAHPPTHAADLTAGSLNRKLLKKARVEGWGGYAVDDSASTALNTARRRGLVAVHHTRSDKTVVFERIDPREAFL